MWMRMKYQMLLGNAACIEPEWEQIMVAIAAARGATCSVSLANDPVAVLS